MFMLFILNEEVEPTDRSKKLAKHIAQHGIYQAALHNAFEEYGGISEERIQEMIDHSIDGMNGGVSKEIVQDMIDESVSDFVTEEDVQSLIDKSIVDVPTDKHIRELVEQTVKQTPSLWFCSATVSSTNKTIELPKTVLDVFCNVIQLEKSQDITIVPSTDMASGAKVYIASEEAVSYTFMGHKATLVPRQVHVYYKVSNAWWYK